MNLALVIALVVLFAVSVPVPVAISIILASAFGITFFSNLPLLVVPQKMFTSLDSFRLLAIPFFIVAAT